MNECPPDFLFYDDYIDENGHIYCCLEGAKIPEGWKLMFEPTKEGIAVRKALRALQIRGGK
jgi:hypothetical protein